MGTGEVEIAGALTKRQLDRTAFALWVFLEVTLVFPAGRSSRGSSCSCCGTRGDLHRHPHQQHSQGKVAVFIMTMVLAMNFPG